MMTERGVFTVSRISSLPAFGNNPPQQPVIKTINPATGELLKEYPVADKAEVRRKVTLARQAQRIWRKTSLKIRRAVFKDVIAMIKSSMDNLAKVISQETGKPVREAIEADIAAAVGVLGYYARIGPKVLKEKRFPMDKSLLMGRVHIERHEPKGVVGVISPWNFPFAIAASGMAASLMGGNAAVLKPSELTPATGEMLVDFFQKALEKHGLPKEVAQVVVGDGSTGAALVNDDIDYAIFTGSVKTGFGVRQAMEARGKTASLELGGSDPMVVLPGADPDAVTSYALWGRFANAGQMCAAVKRLYVPRKDYEKILALLKTKIEKLNVGDPFDPKTHVGPVVSERQRQELEGQIQDAVTKGARVVTGGKAVDGPGSFLQPTLLADVPADARVLNEEVFGPVLPVVPYDSVEEAIEKANVLPYGLTASVFGPAKQARAVAEQLEAGCVMVNDVGATNYALPSVPWSGWKNSGPGTSHSEAGLLETTNRQTLTRNLLYLMPPFRKQPWHFSEQPGEPELPKALVENFATDSKLGKLNPKFWWQVIKNRGSKKI